VLESDTPRLPDAEADGDRDSMGGCIACSTIASQSIALGAGHTPACSGVHVGYQLEIMLA
jgi:hypothetical protein